MTTISAAASSSGTSASQASQNALLGDYELFLSILTTQIQNQDPLEPMDSSEYTNQLVQYSSVEQAIQTNSNLEKLIAATQSNQIAGYVSYIGNEVTAAGSTTMLSNGSASWDYKVSDPASGTVEIFNSGGTLVYSGEVALESGSHTFTWDGKTDTGGSAADGSYTISFNVKDASGNTENVTTNITGIVDGVDFTSSEPFLKIGNMEIPVSAVQSVTRTS